MDDNGIGSVSNPEVLGAEQGSGLYYAYLCLSTCNHLHIQEDQEIVINGTLALVR